MRCAITVALLGALTGCGGDPQLAREAGPAPHLKESTAPPPIVGLETFFALLGDDDDAKAAIDAIDSRWRDGYAVMLLEIVGFLPRERGSTVLAVLRAHAGGDASSTDELFQWVWRTKPTEHPQYARFKELFYSQIDPRFAAYFDDHTEGSEIRLDEVRWGGVRRDGIPPLASPAMISAAAATYLGEDNEVFGIEINGDARAYPKRILAWHEMFKDTVGGESVAGVYCTLCGSMILYKTTLSGTHYELGTSGFLYRSNKLMYDHETESMWSTLDGEPVIGPLVGKGISLETLPVVTTSWGAWKKRHPKTTVLSLETGHQRDYGEGVAYKEYFASDELMFTVPQIDRRLKNKAEILALRFGDETATPTAIAAAFLREHRVYRSRLGGVEYVVLTDASGANRVYESAGLQWATATETTVLDSEGRTWRLTEAALIGPTGARRIRLAAHRAFWFGWHAAHPDTALIK